ncbi:uncharacterized protein T551_02977 [Pneumocystis jirovecii RU7]|uniref:Uncharacterized protein n=1 Tax=Pneumocystis jirovecii (strain RU7) TaxID=1408657 RepID=A0A0W4ZC72_PNEJ7|nr:uncharacterized protein T551_03612 [Pneumocystis jirovecii RU7]XP_018228448.1 uncharacterized protein T551_02977 [Pneumocystis jirovecii RU7]KTW26040.1 hypothetical protein T551_03612 [Pneumocystis jirovecii RU7]KTW27478.1 hypothetical protein T551_02977 [Pneumocystis jirovecii RU7]
MEKRIEIRYMIRKGNDKLEAMNQDMHETIHFRQHILNVLVLSKSFGINRDINSKKQKPCLNIINDIMSQCLSRRQKKSDRSTYPDSRIT